MSLNAKFLILWDNLFNRNTPTATDTAATFDPLNLIDWRRHTLWKSDTPDLNIIDNPGFEDGDFTDWIASDATIDTTNPNTGTYCAKLVAAGSNVTGPLSDGYTVDPGVLYDVDFSVDVDAYTGGTFRVEVLYFDLSDTVMVAADLNTWTAATVGYEDISKTIGPAGSGADLTFPDGTASIKLRGNWTDTPTGTAYMDDFNVSVPAKYITVDLNQIGNSGFETGDFTDWTAEDATIDDTNPASGIYCAKLVAAGSNVIGAVTDAVTVDPSKIYRHKSKHDVDIHSGGTYRLLALYLDMEDNQISAVAVEDWTGVTTGYETVSESFGPAGSGADNIFPAGTVSIQFRDSWFGTPTGTAYMDDILFYEETAPDRWAMVNHNFESANATVSLESSVDDESAVTTWTERVAGFTPDNNKATWKSFALIGTPQRAWRIKIITAEMAPYLGMIFLGAKLEFTRYMAGAWDPLPYTIRSSTGESEGGNWLGSVVEPFISENTLSLVNVTDSFVRDTLGPVFNNHMRILRPFVTSWDETNHGADVYLVKLRDGAQKSFPYNKSTRSVTLPVNTVVEE